MPPYSYHAPILALMMSRSCADAVQALGFGKLGLGGGPVMARVVSGSAGVGREFEFWRHPGGGSVKSICASIA